MEKSIDAITVRIGIYSGRPNPEMTLTEEMASQFTDLLKSTIGKEPIHPLSHPKLGEFYGFLVQIPDDKIKLSGLPEQVSIVNGVLTSVTKKEQSHWRDVSGIEQFLIRMAYKKGFGDLLKRLNVTEPM